MGDRLPKLADLLEQVRSEIADVAQSRERVQESMSALAQTQAKLGQQAETARRFGREDLAQAALERQEAARSQLAALGLQYDQLLAEEAGLEAKLTTTARALQAKIDALSQLSEQTTVDQMWTYCSRTGHLACISKGFVAASGAVSESDQGP